MNSESWTHELYGHTEDSPRKIPPRYLETAESQRSFLFLSPTCLSSLVKIGYWNSKLFTHKLGPPQKSLPHSTEAHGIEEVIFSPCRMRGPFGRGMHEASSLSSAQHNITFASEVEFALRRTGVKEVFGSIAGFLAPSGTEEDGSRKTGSFGCIGH